MAMMTLKDGTVLNPNSHIGKMRYALARAGYNVPNSWRFFTQVRKDGTRRVKLWLSDSVFESSQRDQKFLEYCLTMVYGARYKGGYFIKNPCPRGSVTSFCIILKN